VGPCSSSQHNAELGCNLHLSSHHYLHLHICIPFSYFWLCFTLAEIQSCWTWKNVSHVLQTSSHAFCIDCNQPRLPAFSPPGYSMDWSHFKALMKLDGMGAAVAEVLGRWHWTKGREVACQVYWRGCPESLRGQYMATGMWTTSQGSKETQITNPIYHHALQVTIILSQSFYPVAIHLLCILHYPFKESVPLFLLIMTTWSHNPAIFSFEACSIILSPSNPPLSFLFHFPNHGLVHTRSKHRYPSYLCTILQKMMYMLYSGFLSHIGPWLSRTSSFINPSQAIYAWPMY